MLQILSNTLSITGSSLRSLVIVFGDTPEILRKSAVLIFLSMRSFQSLQYETAINQASYAQILEYYIMIRIISQALKKFSQIRDSVTKPG